MKLEQAMLLYLPFNTESRETDLDSAVWEKKPEEEAVLSMNKKKRHQKLSKNCEK